MTDSRTRRSLVLAATALALFAGGFGLTLTIVPMPTDAAIGRSSGTADGCDARLSDMHRAFGVSLTKLQSAAEASPAERCAAYRSHLTTIGTAQQVYGACMTGFARDDQVGQLELASNNWRAAIRTSCGE